MKLDCLKGHLKFKAGLGLSVLIGNSSILSSCWVVLFHDYIGKDLGMCRPTQINMVVGMLNSQTFIISLFFRKLEGVLTSSRFLYLNMWSVKHLNWYVLDFHHKPWSDWSDRDMMTHVEPWTSRYRLETWCTKLVQSWKCHACWEWSTNEPQSWIWSSDSDLLRQRSCLHCLLCWDVDSSWQGWRSSELRNNMCLESSGNSSENGICWRAYVQDEPR